MQKGFVQFIILGVGVLILAGVGAWYTKIIQIPNFPPPGCYYKQVQCIQAPCNPILTCGTPSPNPAATSQTPQPTSISADESANWKTYTNQELGFTIKYPPVLSIVNDPKEYKDKTYGIVCPDCPALKYRQEYSLRFLVPLPLETNSPQIYQPYEGLYIDVINNPENYTPRDFVENFTALEAAPRPKIEFRPYIVDGLEGITYGVPTQGGLTEEILVNKGDKLYHFALQQSPVRGVYEPDLHKSIATFKFTN